MRTIDENVVQHPCLIIRSPNTFSDGSVEVEQEEKKPVEKVTRKNTQTSKSKTNVVDDFKSFDPIQIKENTKKRTDEDDAWELLNA